jgi:hypothetical protein
LVFGPSGCGDPPAHQPSGPGADDRDESAGPVLEFPSPCCDVPDAGVDQADASTEAPDSTVPGEDPGAQPEPSDNTPPSAPVVEIIPASPRPSDDLRCRVVEEAVDAEQDVLQHRARWLVDGVDTGNPGWMVPADWTRVGEVWSCSVVANDGFVDGPPGRADARIRPADVNVEPTGLHVAIEPNLPTVDDPLHCIVSGDPDGGPPVAHALTWLRNGVDTGHSQTWVGAEETAVWERWTCRAVSVSTGLTAEDTVIIGEPRPDGQPPEGIRVELVWETPGDPDSSDVGGGQGSDLDLHFIHPLGSWDVPPYDCFWRNKEPNWGDRDLAEDDPHLDIDDTDGWGPEVITLAHPEGNAQEPFIYRVGVFYYSDHNYGPSDATVRIFVDGGGPHSVTFSGFEDRQFWDVATIEWPSGEVTATNRLYPHGFP